MSRSRAERAAGLRYDADIGRAPPFSPCGRRCPAGSMVSGADDQGRETPHPSALRAATFSRKGRREEELIPALPPHAYSRLVPFDRGASRGIVGRMGLRVSRSRAVAGPLDRRASDRTRKRWFSLWWRGGADFARAEQAGPRPCRASSSEADPQIPVRGAGSARSSLFDTIDIDSTSARSRRLRTPPGSAHPSDVEARKPRRRGLAGVFGARKLATAT